MKPRLSIFVIPLVLVFVAIAPSRGQAQGMLPSYLDPFGGARVAPQQTWAEQRMRSVLLQRHDPGCGPAALATLLRFVLDVDVTEEELLKEMIVARLQSGTMQGGFSFRDLMGVAEGRGYETLAGRAPLEELRMLNLPAMVLIERGGMRHFVVLWGVVEDRVHLGDPLIGNVTLPATDFAGEWVGETLLIVLPPQEQLPGAEAKLRHHIGSMDQASLQRGDPFTLGFTYRPLLDEGMPLRTLRSGEF